MGVKAYWDERLLKCVCRSGRTCWNVRATNDERKNNLGSARLPGRKKRISFSLQRYRCFGKALPATHKAPQHGSLPAAKLKLRASSGEFECSGWFSQQAECIQRVLGSSDPHRTQTAREVVFLFRTTAPAEGTSCFSLTSRLWENHRRKTIPLWEMLRKLYSEIGWKTPHLQTFH